MQPATMESANAISLLRTLGINLTEIGDDHAAWTLLLTTDIATTLAESMAD